MGVGACLQAPAPLAPPHDIDCHVGFVGHCVPVLNIYVVQ